MRARVVFCVLLASLLSLTPAWACNCIASEGNEHVMVAYRFTTLLLMTLPPALFYGMVRKIRQWEATEALADGIGPH